MPEMDGWEFLKLKKNSELAPIPTFVVTASDADGIEADAFFQKRFDVDKLLATVRARLENRE